MRPAQTTDHMIFHRGSPSKKRSCFLFNPWDLTRSQSKVEWVPTHLTYVGAKTFYWPLYNGLPSDGHCPGLSGCRGQVRVTSIRTKALPESRTERACYRHRDTYVSYHNGVWCAEVKQPELQGEFSHFSYAFSIIISRYNDEIQYFPVSPTD